MTVRVLVVDDSALARRALTLMLSRDPELEVIGAARDPFHAAEMMGRQRPDVIVLDLEMPRMDGITFLRRLMAQHPIPTVICSSLVGDDSPAAMAALEAGAVDIILKPALSTQATFEAESARIVDVVRAAAHARVERRASPATRAPREPSRREERVAAPLVNERLVAVGASTGGTEAVRVLMEGFGPQSPPVAIVQHMPPGFTATFARRLDQLGTVRVKEAAHGDPLLPGHAVVAPGDRHMAVVRRGGRLHVEISDTPHVNRHRPSVDVLFDSVAELVGPHAVGVLLTGMGDDGARGLLRMREAGAETLAQDERSCVVYGMPREAVRMGAATQELDLARMASAIHDACSR